MSDRSTSFKTASIECHTGQEKDNKISNYERQNCLHRCCVFRRVLFSTRVIWNAVQFETTYFEPTQFNSGRNFSVSTMQTLNDAQLKNHTIQTKCRCRQNTADSNSVGTTFQVNKERLRFFPRRVVDLSVVQMDVVSLLPPSRSMQSCVGLSFLSSLVPSFIQSTDFYAALPQCSEKEVHLLHWNQFLGSVVKVLWTSHLK